jgi:hypothetical protein
MEWKNISVFRIVLSIWLLGVCSVANAQELVPNGNFNYSDECAPQSLSSPVNLEPWTYHFSSPDFFHPCFPTDWSVPFSYWGGGAAFVGEGYAGVCVVGYPNTIREMIAVELLSVLSEGVDYHAQFYVSMMDSAWYASRNIGAYFSENMAPSDLQGLLALEPQVMYNGAGYLDDKQGWMKVEGSFTAQGGERYLTIGNFDTDEETDTLFIEGGGAFRPDQPDFFKLAYYYIDGVSVIPDSIYLGINDIENEEVFNLYPNPAKENVTVETKNEHNMQLELYDAIGGLVLKQNMRSPRENIGVGHLPAGMYVITLLNKGTVVERRRLMLQ